jgi:hypothetical protein
MKCSCDVLSYKNNEINITVRRRMEKWRENPDRAHIKNFRLESLGQ